MRAIGAILLVCSTIGWLIGGNIIYYCACQRKGVVPYPVGDNVFKVFARRDWIRLVALATIVLLTGSIGGTLMRQ
jgi:hypothetical protein